MGRQAGRISGLVQSKKMPFKRALDFSNPALFSFYSLTRSFMPRPVLAPDSPFFSFMRESFSLWNPR